MDKVVEEVEKVKKEWDETCRKTQEHIKAIGEYGKSGRPKEEEKSSLPRLNGVAQDGLALLSSLIFNLDLLAPQLPTEPEVESARELLESWKTLIQTYYFMHRIPISKACWFSSQLCNLARLQYLLIFFFF